MCTFPEVRTYIDGSILHWCVCFRVVYFLKVGRRAVAAVELFWSVIIFSASVPVSLCYQIEAGISAINPFLVPGRIRLSELTGSEMWFSAGRNYLFFCPEGAYLLVPTENIRIALMLYGKVDFNP